MNVDELTFSSPAEALKHHGVKGMHWGHHTTHPGGDSSAKSKKKVTSDDIYNARDRQDARLRRLQEFSDKHTLATNKKGRDEAERMIKKIGDELVNGPDAKLAAKSTTGEKWMKGVGWGLIAFSAITLGGNVAAIAGSKRR